MKAIAGLISAKATISNPDEEITQVTVKPTKAERRIIRQINIG